MSIHPVDLMQVSEDYDPQYMVKASVLADTLNDKGERLTSIQYTAHRYILAEINTHRVFSRNARSSRAVPVKKLIEEVRTIPAMPLSWQANIPGMMPGDELSPEAIEVAKSEWLSAAADAAVHAENLSAGRLHKQWANRVLEPFLWVHGVISSTTWSNFFELRCEGAQKEFEVLANLIKNIIDNHTPVRNQYHLPYISAADWDWVREYMPKADTPDRARCLSLVSGARLARVSVTPFDGDASYAKELQRADDLISNKHWSPFEHVAIVDPHRGYVQDHRNFTGFRQYRAILGG